MVEVVRLDSRSKLDGSGRLAAPRDSARSRPDRLYRAARRWWKLQNTRQIEDEVVESGGRISIRLVLPVVFPVLLVLSLLVWFEPENRVAFISLVCAASAIVYTMIVESVARRLAEPAWLQIASCAFYAAVITALLWTFISLDHPRPHTHWIIFFVYFLLIGAMGLSDDPRQAVCAGGFSIAGYLSGVLMLHYAAANGSSMASQLAPEFEWVANASKVGLLAAATFLAATSASRGRSLRRTSLRDGLTGLLNRHAFDQCLGFVARRSVQSGTRMTVAMVDIDHFKRINDTYGHAAGDAVLRWLASLLHRNFRTTDLVARYGGEEFVVAFPDSDDEVIDDRLETLRNRIESTPLALESEGANVELTISIGCACMPQDGTSVEELLARADERLYEAKRSGRNRIVGTPRD